MKKKKAKFKICVYAICKNEEQFVDRWMDSMSEADKIIVLDTGSTDNTVKKLKKRGAIVHSAIIKPWRFDTARNMSLQYVPANADICVCTDLDEVFNRGWRECLERVWHKGVKQGSYQYYWSLDDNGNPLVQFNYFKIHSRYGFEWKNPVHEYLKCNTENKIIFIEGIILSHYPDSSKSRNSYLPLLELSVLENPQDDRSHYYLGREYNYRMEWDKCIKILKHYLTLHSAVWDDERSAAMRLIAESYANLGDYTDAYSYYLRAIAQKPAMRDNYAEFAFAAYKNQDYATVFFMAEEAIKITQKSMTYINKSSAWDSTLPDYAAMACWNLKMYDKALKYAKLAVELNNGIDERLKNNLNIIWAKAEEIKKK